MSDGEYYYTEDQRTYVLGEKLITVRPRVYENIIELDSNHGNIRITKQDVKHFAETLGMEVVDE